MLEGRIPKGRTSPISSSPINFALLTDRLLFNGLRSVFCRFGELLALTA